MLPTPPSKTSSGKSPAVTLRQLDDVGSRLQVMKDNAMSSFSNEEPMAVDFELLDAMKGDQDVFLECAFMGGCMRISCQDATDDEYMRESCFGTMFNETDVHPPKEIMLESLWFLNQLLLVEWSFSQFDFCYNSDLGAQQMKSASLIGIDDYSNNVRIECHWAPPSRAQDVREFVPCLPGSSNAPIGKDIFYMAIAIGSEWGCVMGCCGGHPFVCTNEIYCNGSNGSGPGDEVLVISTNDNSNCNATKTNEVLVVAHVIEKFVRICARM